jgi:hypothetical protein
MTAELSDGGLQITAGASDTRFRWPMVARYRETPSLLLLTLDNTGVLLLPKRCVPDVNALCAVIQTHVATGTFLPRDAAFPVLAVASTTRSA